MSFFLVFLAIAVAGAAAAAAGGKLPARLQRRIDAPQRPASDGPDEDGAGWRRGEVAALGGLSEHEARLPAVLLPDHPRAEDIDSIRFSVALRGYRMDQVDEVLDALRAELAAKEALIRELARTGPAGGRGTASEEPQQ
ncbi:DivIVA domain-containing protein [Arthrobacter sp. I2-34]|uniref:DivIVA domain-containing protein n=1 Tax=Arthrobacter hankyongi TaxID=2904801 RepID=A0ABS9LD17_9MICC|nr:DivIVA domain-containing protein [Arthrobacter hankyongi]MCG2624493.1 DivIVA domain-containing protein [Arthrobacter hankyongi]